MPRPHCALRALHNATTHPWQPGNMASWHARATISFSLLTRRRPLRSARCEQSQCDCQPQPLVSQRRPTVTG
eukprot:1232001-Alexandrium_andersonii.AAC.1